MALFTRTTPAPAPAPETWTPEGTFVSQRYRALEGATVLVYTADADRGTAHYAAACLGCTYRADQNASHNPMSETEAAKAANAHATACRAMPRGVPTRPDDTEAAELIRTRLWRHRYGTAPRPVHLADFNALRVDLQRSTNWIKGLLASLAQAEPGFLTATAASSGQATRFTVQPFGRLRRPRGPRVRRRQGPAPADQGVRHGGRPRPGRAAVLLLVVRPRLSGADRASFLYWAQLDEDAIRDCMQGDPRAARIRVLSALAVRKFLYLRRAVDLSLTALALLALAAASLAL